MRTGFSKLLSLLLSMMVLHLHAQDPQVPAPLLPTNQLPNLQNRINQLQNQGGVPPDQIESYIQGITGGRPPGPGTLSPTAESGFPEPGAPSEQADVELEGTEDVLEEDAGFGDRPTENQTINLNPDLSTNVYGHHLFEPGKEIQFTTDGAIAPPNSYIIGPGDIFAITIYGPSEIFETLTVKDDGAVQRQYIGKIYVAGRTLGESRELIERAYRTVVPPKSTIEIRLTGDRRSISVNIVGEVRQPGNYRIDAAVPAFNALFAAGGVNKVGSVRNIQIRRDGKVVQTLDLYRYLIEGQEDPIFLQNNDIVYVPIQNKTVEISGAVRRPMAYELMPSENLKRLIDFAGGLNFDAKTTRAQVARLEDEREVLVDFNLQNILDAPKKDYVLGSGDRVIIEGINLGAYNVVQVFGDVEYPGTYQLENNDRVVDLIERAGGLGIDAYLRRAYVVRIVPGTSEILYIPVDLSRIYLPGAPAPDTSDIDNIELQYFDALLIFSQSELRDQRFIEVEGEVRNPGVFPSFPTMTVKDLLYLVNGPKKDADLQNLELSIVTRAENYYIPTDEEDDSGQLRPGDFMNGPVPGEGAEQGEGEAGVEEGADAEGGEVMGQEVVRRVQVKGNWEDDPTLDTMLVYNFDRLRVYSKYDFLNIQYIEIAGAVRRPGLYQLQRGITLKDLLYQAGGLTDSADVNEIELYQDIDLEERGNFNTRTPRKEIIRIRIEGEDWQESEVADTVLLDDFYRVVIRSESDFFQQGLVKVKGLVNAPGEYDVSPNMTLRDVLYQAEGLKMQADFQRVELSRVIETLSETGEVIPVPIVVSSIEVSQNWQEDEALDNIKINAFDQVIVRRNPNFDLQQSVFVEGEILVEGEYHKTRRNEPLSSFISRAGGVTDLAYLEGAFIERPEIGQISIKLERALNRPGSKWDIPMLEGDTLVIPPRTDIVTVEGNVLRSDINVLYEPSRRKMKYYVNLAGGFDRRTKKNHCTVTYADGSVHGVRHFLFFRRYPKVEQGSVINVPEKPERKGVFGGDGVNINLQNVLQQATAVLTFIVLLERTI